MVEYGKFNYAPGGERILATLADFNWELTQRDVTVTIRVCSRGAAFERAFRSDWKGIDG